MRKERPGKGQNRQRHEEREMRSGNRSAEGACDDADAHSQRREEKQHRYGCDHASSD